MSSPKKAYHNLPLVVWQTVVGGLEQSLTSIFDGCAQPELWTPWQAELKNCAWRNI